MCCQAAIGIILSLFVGAIRHDTLLQEMGYQPAGPNISLGEQFRYGFAFMLYYALSLLAMVTSTQILKYSIRRQRPKSLSYTIRMHNLRKVDDGTYSMPSGDSSAAALFCFEYCYMLGLPSVYMLLPLVMCGRVYYQCHWFGDTIIGALVGTAWGLIMVSQFSYSLPLQQFITGPNTFLPVSY